MRVDHEFELVGCCPADGRPDFYTCTVRCARMIPVEEILEKAASFRDQKMYQEQVTEALAQSLGAEVETIGWHSEVRTRVVCGGI